MLVKLLQFSNVPKPILVTLFGIVMLVRLLQLLNASLPMLVTPIGILNVLSFFPIAYCISFVLSLLYKFPPIED